MKLFKKRIIAVLVAILIVVSSTLLSANIKLTKEFRDVTDGFYNGVLVDGKRDTSIHSQLLIVGKEAANLAAIAERNGIDVSQFKSDADYFSRDVITMQDDISYINYCYRDILEKITEVSYSLTAVELSQNDETAAINSLQAIMNAQSLIDASGYNESVRQYLSSLPILTEFFAELAGVWPPEYFA